LRTCQITRTGGHCCSARWDAKPKVNIPFLHYNHRHFSVVTSKKKSALRLQQHVPWDARKSSTKPLYGLEPQIRYLAKEITENPKKRAIPPE